MTTLEVGLVLTNCAAIGAFTLAHLRANRERRNAAHLKESFNKLCCKTANLHELLQSVIDTGIIAKVPEMMSIRKDRKGAEFRSAFIQAASYVNPPS